MNPDSIEFIYQATNAIASGKFDAEVERLLSEAVEEELVAINTRTALEPEKEITPPHLV